MNIHPGYYKSGNILPIETTKGSHTVFKKQLCIDCYNKIIVNYNSMDDKRNTFLLSLVFIQLPFIAILMLKEKFLYVITLLQ